MNSGANERLTFKKLILLTVFGVLFYLFVSNPEYLAKGVKIVKPVVSAFIIAYLLDPLVKFTSTKLKIKRGRSVLIIFGLFIVLIIFIIQIVVPSIAQSTTEIIKSIPSSREEVDRAVGSILSGFGSKELSASVMAYLDESIEYIIQNFSTLASKLIEGVMTRIVYITSGIFSTVISVFIAIYMLLDKEDLMARFKRMLYAYNKKDDADHILYVARKSNEIFLSFFNGKFLDSAIIGALCFVILLVVRIPYALVIALIIGATNMIPYFGPFMGGIPAVIITLITSPNPMQAVWLGIIIIALQQFDGLYLGPKILGDKVGVGAFWIITSVTVGGAIMGVWGMLLGVPVTVLVKTLVEQSVARRLEEKDMEDLEIDNLK
ncbi:AI-2E family transporter [Wukongibacter baidiensis]|uniref:AI-2E family transporter n=1 Tax=Wukongibacter baidiensis TaxID=1723361 RepID=UPI003D7F43F1